MPVILTATARLGLYIALLTVLRSAKALIDADAAGLKKVIFLADGDL